MDCIRKSSKHRPSVSRPPSHDHDQENNDKSTSRHHHVRPLDYLKASIRQHLPLAVGHHNKYSPYRIPSPDDTSKLRPVFGCTPPHQPQLLRLRHSVPLLPPTAWADPLIVWNLMCWKDVTYSREHRPWTGRIVTTNPGYGHRKVLLDWMAEVSQMYRLQRETYHVAVDILDRYMATVSTIHPFKLQVFGITALFVAAKIEEIYPPKLADFVYVGDGCCTENDVRDTEAVMLSAIKWALLPMTAVHWLSAYLQILAYEQNLGQSNNLLVFPVRTLMVALACNVDNGWNGMLLQPRRHSICIPTKPVSDRTQHRTTSECQTSDESPASVSTSFEKPRATRRALFSSLKKTTRTNDGNLGNGVQDAFTTANYDTTAFKSVCQLIDLCLLDDGWLCFEYGVVAASALYLMANSPDDALRCSGYRASDLSSCCDWMRPFFDVIMSMPPPDASVVSRQRSGCCSVAINELHYIQLHNKQVTDSVVANIQSWVIDG